MAEQVAVIKNIYLSKSKKQHASKYLVGLSGAFQNIQEEMLDWPSLTEALLHIQRLETKPNHQNKTSQTKTPQNSPLEIAEIQAAGDPSDSPPGQIFKSHKSPQLH